MVVAINFLRDPTTGQILFDGNGNPIISNNPNDTNIVIGPGTVTIDAMTVFFSDLPTVDPGIVGQAWNNGGELAISNGP